MRVEVVESSTKVVVETSDFVVSASLQNVTVIREDTAVLVVPQVIAPQIVRVERVSSVIVPEIAEVRVISVGEQGPPGVMTYRVVTGTWDSDLLVSWSAYDLFRMELEGPTDITFTAAMDGQRVILELTQDPVGGRAVTFLSSIRYSTLIPSITLSTAAGATDRLGFMYNAGTDTYDLMALARGF